MQLPTRRVPEWRDADARTFIEEIVPSYAPAVLRGLVGSWPAVAAAAASEEQACRHVAGFYRGAPVEAFVAEPQTGGRFFYGADMARFNFEKQQERLTDVLGYLISEGGKAEAPAVYVGAASIPDCLPGFDAANPLPLLHGKPAVPRNWIGNRTSVSTHFDLSDNIACVVAGRRRFILFPPDQLPNLYVGPLDHTMAGQPASMVPVGTMRLPTPDRRSRRWRTLSLRSVICRTRAARRGVGCSIIMSSVRQVKIPLRICPRNIAASSAAPPQSSALE